MMQLEIGWEGLPRMNTFNEHLMKLLLTRDLWFFFCAELYI